ncbi:MAG: hypothetical protein QXU18_05890 [Thermoplasmatales archaeon]
MNGFRGSVSELKEDYTHGSSWYFERIAQILLDIDKNDLNSFVKSLGSIRPGMGSIANIEDILARSKFLTKEDVRRMGSKLLDYKKRSEAYLKSEIRKIKIRKAITISYSSAVKVMIEGSGLEELFLLRSRPGSEYRQAEREYGRFCKVTVIPDSAMFEFTKSVDAVLIGFDGLYSNGYLLNKVGTTPLCLSAKELGINTYAIGESYKASDKPFDVTMEKRIVSGGKTLRVSIFDKVPLSLITELVTDLGAFRKPSSAIVEKIHGEFLKGISK